MVVMAVFTTVITEPLLRILYPEGPRRAGDRRGRAHRLRARRRRSGCWSAPPRATPARPWPPWRPSSPPARTPARWPSSSSGRPTETLEVGGGIEAMATSLDALHHLETTVEAAGVPVFARSRTTDDPGRLLGLLADESVADIVLVPEDPTYTPPGGSQAAGRAHGPPAPRRRGPPPRVTVAVVAPRRRATTCTPSTSRLRLAGRPRARPLQVDRLARAEGSAPASPGCRTSGLVGDGSTAAAGLRSTPARSRPRTAAGPTLGVWGGRDDGVERLVALVDRLGRRRLGPECLSRPPERTPGVTYHRPDVDPRRT